MKTPQAKTITSPKNPIIGEFRDHFSRSSFRKSPLFPVEGPTLFLEAIQSGLHMEAMLVGDQFAGRAEILAAIEQSVQRGATVYQVNERLLGKAAATEHPQGLLALFRKPLPLETGALSDKRLPVLTLIDVQDPGNCGALARTFLAFGGRSILTAGATADLYGAKAVRASAGAVFRVACAHYSSAQELLQDRVVRALSWVATTVSSGNLPEKCRTEPPFLLLIGSEGSGLPKELLEHCGERLSLPMSPSMESLNAAVAGSLIIYELSRSLGFGPFASSRLKP